MFFFYRKKEKRRFFVQWKARDMEDASLFYFSSPDSKLLFTQVPVVNFFFFAF